MTIDELTVKITVAAEEAEAALDTLMEKLQTLREKTGLALQLDAGSWDSQLAETGEGFQQGSKTSRTVSSMIFETYSFTESALAKFCSLIQLSVT